MNNELTQLRQFILDHFSLNDLRTLCFELGIDFEEFDEGGKSTKVHGILLWLGKRQRFDELLHWLRQTRTVSFDAVGLNFDPAFVNILYSQLPTSSENLSIGKLNTYKPIGFLKDKIKFLLFILLFSLVTSAIFLISSKSLDFGSVSPLTQTPSPVEIPSNIPVITNVDALVVRPGSLTISWSWEGELSANQNFAVRFWPVDEPEQRHSIVWTKETSYSLEIQNEAFPPGNYYYNVAVIKDNTPFSNQIDDSWILLNRTAPKFITIPDE